MRNYVMLVAIAVGLLVGFGAARAAQTQTPLTMAGVPDLDIVGEATIGELTTRTTGMTITGGIHPTVGDDAIDVAVLAAAAE